MTFYDPIWKKGWAFLSARLSTLNQQTPIEPPGLTIVSFIPFEQCHRIRTQADYLAQGHPTVQPLAARPHVTFQGITAMNSPAMTDEQRPKLIAAVSRVTSQFCRGQEPFWLRFNKVRLGVGQIVWLAEHPSAARVAAARTQLISLFQAEVGSICPDLLLKIEGGIKTTLAYFSAPEDFWIDQKLTAILQDAEDSSIDVLVDSLSLAEFSFKSLADARVLETFPLGLPGVGRPEPVVPKLMPPKVRLSERWLPFRGLSYLFVNPGGHQAVPAGGRQVMACDPWRHSKEKRDPALKLYARLFEALTAFGMHRVDPRLSWVPLPADTYHVTVFDAVNDENLPKFAESAQSTFGRFLQGLPGSLPGQPLVDRRAFRPALHRPVTYRFSKLTFWGNKVLVARLEPADAESEAIHKRICDQRIKLDEEWRKWGRPEAPDYKPHVSLGYFCEPDLAVAITPNLPQMEENFRKLTDGCSISFDGIDLYGFKDMASFFRAHP